MLLRHPRYRGQQDPRGAANYNKTLSQKRADSARKYLVSKGIDGSRITAAGYGESKLINNCADNIECTNEAHFENRRTEFKVTGIVGGKYFEMESGGNK